MRDMAPGTDRLHPEVRRRVVCLGAAAIDHVFTVDAIPPRPTKVQATSYRERLGGGAAIAALTVAELGHMAADWGRLGDDANGARILAWLRRAGVDCTVVRRIAGGKSATAAAIHDAAGDRLRAGFAGGGLDDDPAWLPLDTRARTDAGLAAILPADVVLVDASWPAGARGLLRAARATGVPSVLVARADMDEPACIAELAALADHAPVATARDGEGFHGAFALAVARGLDAAQARRFAADVAAMRARGTP